MLIIGFQAGRVTSPYYATHPIIFQEECKTANSSGGSAEELLALKNAGKEQPTEQANAVAGEDSALQPKTTPTVAGANTRQEHSGQFVGSKNSDKYHHLDCSTWKSIKEENQVWFTSREDAESKGYKPTKCTADKLGI